MPALGRMLNDDQIASVLTYVRNVRGNVAPVVNAKDIAKRAGGLAKGGD